MLKDRRVLIIVAAPHGTTLPMRILMTPRKNQYLAMTVAQKETVRRYQLKIREDAVMSQLRALPVEVYRGIGRRAASAVFKLSLPLPFIAE